MSNVKNIWHIFSTLSVGGPQRRFADYIANTKANFQHQAYAMDGRYEALELIPSMTPLFDGKQVVSKGNTVAATLQARELLKIHRPNLLVTYNWGATEWALGNSFFPACPTIHIQDGFTEDEQEKEITLRRYMRIFSYRTCKKIIVPSLTLYNQVQKGWHVSQKRLQFIPNGIELERFSDEADPHLLKAHKIDTSKTIIGTVAALRLEKNLGRLIEAYSYVEDKHPNTQLVIVGDGVGMSPLKMLADRVCRKGSVIFTGNLPNPEKLLPAFNIFGLSSDTEQMPLSVIEAMAVGLPIASTDVGDIKEMVTEKNKPFVAGRDAKLLAQNLSNLIENTAEANHIGRANKARAHEKYALSAMIDCYDTLFNNTAD